MRLKITKQFSGWHVKSVWNIKVPSSVHISLTKSTFEEASKIAYEFSLVTNKYYSDVYRKSLHSEYSKNYPHFAGYLKSIFLKQNPGKYYQALDGSLIKQ